MKVIMSVLSSQRERGGVFLPVCLWWSRWDSCAPPSVRMSRSKILASLFHLPKYMSSNGGGGRVGAGLGLQSLIQTFRKRSTPPSRELPPNTPLFIILLLSPAVTN